ncbi:MAG: deoxyhypusine synthase family protein [Phycisphaerae bacterium]
MMGEHDEAARRYLGGPTIEPLRLAGTENVADMIERVYARSGFNGRRLAEAARLFSQMLDGPTTVALTLAGAMTPIGMSGPIISLIERGFVDFIVSTGANLYHDLHRPFEMPMVQGSAEVDDEELAGLGVARIYDVFIKDDETLMATDRAIFEALRRLDSDGPLSTAMVHHAMGRAVAETAAHPDKSLLVAAAEYDVPVYSPSPGDSSIGMNLILSHIFDRPIRLDPIRDVIETAAIVRAAESNGVVEIGGGAPKNFYLQTQPTLHQILLEAGQRGHDYVIQLTTDAPHWGGLSGATVSEARSWGKVKHAHRNNVVVYSCASVTFPLLAQYVLIRNRPRPHKRLYRCVPELVEQLGRSARGNERLVRQLAAYYDVGHQG